jgi:hypothetical protein
MSALALGKRSVWLFAEGGSGRANRRAGVNRGGLWLLATARNRGMNDNNDSNNSNNINCCARNGGEEARAWLFADRERWRKGKGYGGRVCLFASTKGDGVWRVAVHECEGASYGVISVCARDERKSNNNTTTTTTTARA